MTDAGAGPIGHRRGARLWPAAAVLVLLGATLLVVWVPDAANRQEQVLKTIAAVLLAVILLLAWLLFFSRLRWKLRLVALGGVILVGVLAGSSVRISGVSGDVLPLLSWRWSNPRLTQFGARPSEAAAAGAIRSAFDHPQFLGARRDGTVSGVRLDPDWAARPPRVLWRRAVGPGWSGFAVAGDFAVTHEQHGDEERVTCYDVATGEPRWAHSDPVRFEEPLSGAGPRATPVIVDGRVFTQGATGLLNALDLRTGERVWTVDIAADNGSTPPPYGFSASPLVLDGRVIVPAGGATQRSLVAYDADSGMRVWSGGGDRAAYSSPLFVEGLAGRPQVVLLNQDNVTGHDPGDGRVLWATPWPGGTENVSQPVALTGSRVFVSSGYGVGGKLYRIAEAASGGLTANLQWESRALKAKLSNVVHRDGYLYGLDDGILACVRVDDGSRVWKGGRFGHGQLLLVEGTLLIQAENGDVALVDAAPDEFRELARIPALRRKTWNHPALAGSRLLVRNDREAICLELPLL